MQCPHLLVGHSRRLRQKHLRSTVDLALPLVVYPTSEPTHADASYHAKEQRGGGENTRCFIRSERVLLLADDASRRRPARA
jgi:hypothetical protein